MHVGQVQAISLADEVEAGVAAEDKQDVGFASWILNADEVEPRMDKSGASDCVGGREKKSNEGVFPSWSKRVRWPM